MPISPLILLVEDDFMTRELHKQALRNHAQGIPVGTAADGLEALRVLRTCPNAPILVLLDMHMPHMDGLAFLEAYFAWPASQRAHTHIVVLSGTLDPEHRRRIHQLGLRFLAKPLTVPLIQELVRALHQHPAEQEIIEATPNPVALAGR